MSKNFTSVMYTYPWDIADEGIDTALNKISDLTGCTEVLLTPSYHVSNYFSPHNPLRPIHLGDNGAVYFQPEVERYAGIAIKPRVSPDVVDAAYFDRIVDAIRDRGLTFSAWIVYFFNHYVSSKYPEFAKQDAFGTPYVGQISPSSESAQEYAVALTAEIMERYQPHAVRIEALQRQMWRHGLLKNKFVGDISERCQFLLGICFNSASMANAEEGGLDVQTFRDDVVEWLRPRMARLPRDEDLLSVDDDWLNEAFEGRLRQYVDSLNSVTTNLWVRVAQVIKNAGGKVQSDYLTGPGRTWINGLKPSINREIDRLTVGTPSSAEELQSYLEMIATDGEVFVPVGPGNVLEAGPLIERTKDAKNVGAKGALFYNYGLLREEQLGFVGQAVRAVSCD